MKKTQVSKEELKEKIEKLKVIADREKATNATFVDAYEDEFAPPYIFSALVFSEFADLAESVGEPVDEITNSCRIRGKAEQAILNALGKVGQGVMYAGGGFMALFVGALTTPISLPRLGLVAGKAAVNSTYNKRIDKAKVKVANLEKQLAEMSQEETVEKQ